MAKKIKYKVQILRGYTIKLPKQIIERLGVKEGDSIILTIEENEIVITRDPKDILLSLLEEEEAPYVTGDELFLKEVRDKLKRCGDEIY